ncbi:serine/arginine-rich splicing factor SR45a isoform X3 [Dioscorea cayenensis subsp. rotundata]|nr:serine/arginine-rich splicing factor SR45a isoform X3 [Dioscorea cayenensis subsp. rotundata]XP_039128303.1 serine/arginine-rich splicing factor SR45a isoform X3 [Dioscorea cayenensis subsp. rotundata]XP_039128304.1 serine/arginine-rich splicing factor SR45a isoform X3 [Dioscorea cayenensis subsp. rotundata]
MSYSRRSRYASRSPSPYGDARSGSSSLSRSRSRSPDFSDVENPGNNLYVTGLSSRLTKDELEKHFATEGKVSDVHLVVDPWSRESRGFGFVTMETIEDANRCLKYLDGSVLEGRAITVEKARRRRGRTPTPGRYLGARTFHSRRRSPSDSRCYRSPSYTCERDRSYSPYYRRYRSYSGSRSPYYRRGSVSPVNETSFLLS